MHGTPVAPTQSLQLAIDLRFPLADDAPQTVLVQPLLGESILLLVQLPVEHLAPLFVLGVAPIGPPCCPPVPHACALRPTLEPLLALLERRALLGHFRILH